MNEEQTREAIKSALEALIASGFVYPLEFLIRCAAGGFFGMRVLEDGTVRNEFRGKRQQRVTLPLSIDLFDSNGRHHTLNVVDNCDDHKEMENSMQEELVQ